MFSLFPLFIPLLFPFLLAGMEVQWVVSAEGATPKNPDTGREEEEEEEEEGGGTEENLSIVSDEMRRASLGDIVPAISEVMTSSELSLEILESRSRIS